MPLSFELVAIRRAGMRFWKSGSWLSVFVRLARQGAWVSAALLVVVLAFWVVLFDGARAWFTDNITRPVFSWFGTQLPGWLELVASSALALIASLALVVVAALIGFIAGTRYRAPVVRPDQPQPELAPLPRERVRALCEKWLALANTVKAATRQIPQGGWLEMDHGPSRPALSDAQRIEFNEAVAEMRELGISVAGRMQSSLSGTSTPRLLREASRELCRKSGIDPNDYAPLA